MAAAAELTRAIHDNRCRPYCRGVVIRSNLAPRLIVVAQFENDGHWTARIENTSYAAVQPVDVWEFEIDEVRALLPRANDRPSEPRADEVPPPARHKPGTKPTDDWPKELAAELIHIAVVDRKALHNIDKLVKRIQKDFDDTNRFLPQDPKRVRAKIVLLLKHVR
jgi:hypothetical protein